MMEKICVKSMASIILMVLPIVCGVYMVGSCASGIALAESDTCVEYDRMFCGTIEQLGLVDDGITLAHKRTLYDVGIEELGIAYEFTNGNNNGYVIILNCAEGLIVTEASCAAKSPYINVQGVPIYVKEFCYWEEIDGVFYALDGSNVEATAEEMDTIYSNRYSAVGDSLISGSETIYYLSKTESTSSMAQVIPEYYYEAKPNACVAISAANIVAYYDRFCVDLIENYTPGSGLGNFYRYRDQNQTIETLIDQLYTVMQTNQTGSGTTIAQFLSGMVQYCTSKGYSAVLTSAMSDNIFDYDLAKQKIEDKKPLILFVSEMEIAEINTGVTQDTYNLLYGAISHSLSVFGYREIEYSMSDGSTLQSNFMLVATGIKRCPKAYLNMNGMLQIDDAYIVDITE